MHASVHIPVPLHVEIQFDVCTLFSYHVYLKSIYFVLLYFIFFPDIITFHESWTDNNYSLKNFPNQMIQ